MKEQDIILLAAIDDMISQAPSVGICPTAFRTLKKEVIRIMGERDGYAERLRNCPCRR